MNAYAVGKEIQSQYNFVEFYCVMCRIGRGIWRRGPETPMAVKWEDRGIEVREGSWSYIASATSVGYAPGNFSTLNNCLMSILYLS
jgi:hypothetical protein